MKHIYRVFTVSKNLQEKKNTFWQECEENRIVNINATKKRLYTYVDWDYKTLDKYLQINASWSNCNKICKDKLVKLRENYMRTVRLPRKQQFYAIQENVGGFYIKNEDIDTILPKICEIFDEVIKSDCLKIVPVEEFLKNLSAKDERIIKLLNPDAKI